MESIAEARNTTQELLLADHVGYTISKNIPLSQLLQYTIDTASDQFVAEEYYHRFPDLVTWLARAGTGEEEVVLRDYVQRNPQIFTCREPECKGRIVGACPILYCEACGTEYFLYLDNVSKTMCERCVANELGECSPQRRRTRKPIYGILRGGKHGIQC